MPAFTADRGMIVGGGPAGTMARRRVPPPVVETGVARADPASKSKISAGRAEKAARRTKP
jgi:hypothetical protein